MYKRGFEWTEHKSFRPTSPLFRYRLCATGYYRQLMRDRVGR